VSAPSFLILGTMKGGTTSLFAHLVSHPFVTPPVTKEIHFFDLNFRKGGEWYAAQLRAGDRSPGRPFTGEASPYYMFHPEAPRRVAETCPRARLLVLLREPVARAFSHYHHAVRHGFEVLPPEPAFAAEEERIGLQRRLLREGAIEDAPAFQHLSYQARGRYAEQLEAWLEHFPPRQILVLQSERLFRHPAEVCRQARSFVGLPDFGAPPVGKLNAGAYPPPPPRLAEALRKEFEPANDSLARLLKARWTQELDFSLWG
jgi:hypothetical protein